MFIIKPHQKLKPESFSKFRTSHNYLNYD